MRLLLARFPRIRATERLGAAPKDRASRSFRFDQKRKYVQIANQMRQEAEAAYCGECEEGELG
jgi:hypothetical protein